MAEQKQVEIVSQQVFSAGVVCPNDREVAYARNLNALDLLNLSYIIKIERYDETNINKLNSREIRNLSASSNDYQDTYEDSLVVQYFQLNKGISKNQEQIRTIEESQLNSNSPIFLFYERDMQTDEGVFLDNLNKRIKSTEKEVWVVLEIESKRIKEKIEVALSLGVKNFIIRAGKYDEPSLWVWIINTIHKKEGLVFVALPRRMHDKISYIKDFFEFGADFVFHEVFSGWGNGILNLTPDYRYVDMPFSKVVEGYDEQFEHMRENLKYGFSRVRAINVANSNAGTIEVLQIL